MQELRANTQVKVIIGPAVAVGDGFTPVTTLDLSTADEAELLKHDAAAVTSIAAATFAAITSADGYYNLTLTTSLTDTEGLLTVCINDDSLILPIIARFMVLSEAAWDSKYVAKDDGFMDVNIKTIGRADTQETEASNLETACANYSATRGLTGTAVPAAAADAAGGLPISDAGGLDLDAKIGALTYGTANRVNVQVYGMEAGTVTAAAIANGAIDAATFAADVDAEILSYLVDDATRIDASALNTLSGHDPGETIAGATDGILASGTSDSGTTTTMVDSARTEADDDYWKGARIRFTSGTIAGQVRLITGFTASSDTITFAPATTQTVGTQTYEILPASRVDVHQHLGSFWQGSNGIPYVNVEYFGGIGGTFNGGRPEVNTSHWAGTAVGSTEVRANLINIAGSAVNTSSAQLGVNVVNAGGTAWASGSLTSGVFAAGAITAAAIADGAIDAATFAADVDAEVLSYIVDDATRIDASSLNTASVTTIPAIAADNPNRPTRGVQFDNHVFTMVDATDFNTPETGVTVTATISKDGGAFASCSNSVSEISGGFYKITLTATEMTADVVALKFTGTGCAQRNYVFRTQPT